jgi:hypothetical protein
MPDWCPNGNFLTGLDLDRADVIDAVFSPVIGQAQCCPLATGQSSSWDGCYWVLIGNNGRDSHQPKAWCGDGSYLTALELLTGSDVLEEDPMDYPVVEAAECCGMAATQYTKWSSCSWVGVESAGINSHGQETWCPNGSFMVGFDLDRAGDYDEWDSPVVGQAYCCKP